MKEYPILLTVRNITSFSLIVIALTMFSPIWVRAEKDIRKFTQHFIDPEDISPWTFVPQENIARLSTKEHPGMVTLSEAGRGQDIKGILQEPILLDDYPPPWEFHLGWIQKINISKVTEKQLNYAIGLNVAITFSDPETWPEDRSEMPPDTHSAQLFVVHLGNYGETHRPGLPQVKRSALNYGDPAPEVYLVYGRGDLAENITGNWDVAYTWVGPEESIPQSMSKMGGPASHDLRFRVGVLNPTTIKFGFCSGFSRDWRTRTVDVSKFGEITGIWEIGPIISLDDWMTEDLPKELGIDGVPSWMESLRVRYESPRGEQAPETLKPFEELFKVDAPDPNFEYLIDSMVFFGNGAATLEHISDDFDIPGFNADTHFYIEGNAFCETFSNPGYLSITFFGDGATWAMCPRFPLEGILAGIDLTKFEPPIEFETSFIAGDDNIPWNVWWTFNLFDEDGGGLGQGWGPGVQNIPGKGRHFINSFSWEPDKIAESKIMNVEFVPEIPQAILQSKPLTMLIQVLDRSHVRIGFRGKDSEGWTFSETIDTVANFGKKIGSIGYPCLASMQGRQGAKGWGVGNYPGYQKLLIDYVHLRYGRTK